MDIISSKQNKSVRYIKSLQTKPRFRRRERKLILEGDRLIADALASRGKPDIVLYLPGRADYEIIGQLQGRGCALQPVSEAVLQYVSDTQQAPGILAAFQLPRPPLPQRAERVMILDAVGEPGNLGAILRTAGAAGVDLAILAPGCVDPYNSKAVRAGMGAHFRLPIVEASWPEIGAYCRDLSVYVAMPDASTRHTEVNWLESWALIFGSEARGISKSALDLARRQISIPMMGAAESLNVAAAAAVILFEAQRQRLASAKR
ncbi:MAG: RNA methyltransferase [Chloroflexi bacterium]|nr:RNA methyltransferase [Chloroflexota bacterium]